MFRLKRNITESINYLLNNFPCVVILGARQVGKSTLLKQILPNASFFDLERDADFQRINNDPELLLQETNRPIIFDEAQISASLFKALRVEIDKNRDQAGQFLLSGSSSPELLKHISETLAGRVAIVELEPFQWQEGLKKNYPDLITALSEEEFQSLQPNFNKRELLELCLYGGYPEPFLKRDDTKFFRLWMENYIKTYVERDIRALFPSLQLDVYKRFVQMLAYASGEIINNSNFARSLDVSQPTIKNYLNIIEGTFLWRKIPSYQKNLTKRIIKMPKGYLRDTGLINYFLRIQTVNDLKSHPQFGRIWEIFISEQLIRHFKNNIENIEYFYYRTHNQAEIDLIIETQTGLIPIEIKSGFSSSKRQIQTLQRFIEEHHCPFGLLINNGDEIFKLSQNIYQLPAIYL
jgi:predicted AAA+ superfamily ATPase